MKFLVLIFFLFQSFYSYSKFEWNSNCNKAYKEILLLEFNTANQIILEEKIRNLNLNVSNFDILKMEKENYYFIFGSFSVVENFLQRYISK